MFSAKSVLTYVCVLTEDITVQKSFKMTKLSRNSVITNGNTGA